MTKHERNFPRSASGLVAIRADANDPVKLIGDLNTAFSAFKETQAQQIAELKKGISDAVTADKLDKINSEISTLQKAIDEGAKKVAALNIGAATGADVTTEIKAYRSAFDAWFRKGDVSADLNELAVKAAMQTQSNPDGGYLVSDEVETAIDRVLGKYSAIRSLATVRKISTGTYKKHVNLGGATSGWVGETEARPPTDGPKLSEIEINAMELYANPQVTQTLLDDARVDIAALLADEVSVEFSEQESAAFISGNGVKKPLGILGYNTVADASYAWGKLGYIASGVAADITDGSHNGSDALYDLIYSIKKGYRQNGTFLMNRKTLAAVRKLKDENGNYLWEPSLKVGEPATLAGYPVEDDDNMPDIGANAYPIAFGDFKRGYLIVDRFGIRTLRDPYSNKPFVQFYTTKRVGGGIQDFAAIKLLKVAAS